MKAAIAAVVQELRREQAFLLDLTQQLVRIPTVNPKIEADPALNHEADLQYYLRTVLDGFGMRTETTEVFPGRPNLFATLPGQDAHSLILSGHIDTRAVGERAKWRTAPFGGAIADGRLHGRGAWSGKSGLAAAVAVARAVSRSGVALGGRLELHAVVDGVAGGFGARDLLKRGRRADGAIALDPTGEALMVAAVGLEWVRVTLRGQKAEAAARHRALFPQAAAPGWPPPGVNALELAARLLAAVRELERDWTVRKAAHPLLPPGINTIHPSALLTGAGLGANGLPRAPANPGQTPDIAVLDFELAFLPDEIAEDVRSDFEDFVHAFAQQDSWLRENPPRVQWDLYGVHYPPLNTHADDKIVRAIVDSRAARSEKTRIEGFAGASDAGHYAGAGMPAVLFGPAGEAMQEADEFVDVASLLGVAETLAATAVAWCGVK